MFTLRLLGGATLESGEGTLTGRATQRRRMALLSLLATAPGYTLSRDKLIAHLWPETDAEQARHLLSVALYDLRRALGEEAIASRGDDVTLGVERVAPDVVDFERALADGDAARAVALYAGPFLDGVFVSDAPEFERWAEGERARLERRFRDALETLAETRATAGDARGAVEAWRRLAACDPYNSRVAAALMRALAAAGDPAGALQHARIHESLLQEEYGVSPDAEVTALAERLRREPAPGVAEVPRAPLPAPQRPPASPSAASVSAADALPSPAVTAPPSAPARRRWRRQVWKRAALAGAAGALAGLALAGLWGAQRAGARPEPAEVPPSVAVLPFSDVSPAGDNEYFSDGLAEEITTALSQVEGLRVASRTSAFRFRGAGTDVREVGRQLAVGSVLEGSVRKADDQLRITVRLVDAASGYDVWSHSYDRPMVDVFGVQDEIARAVVAALRMRLVGGDTATLVRATTRDQEAYNHYLRGRYHLYRRTGPGFAQAIASFRAAVARDSTYALAYAGLADAYSLLASHDYGIRRPDEVMPLAREAAERALRHDPALAAAHATLGNIHLTYDRDWEAAERSFRRAVELSPSYAQAHHWHSLLLLTRGRNEEARAAMLRASELEAASLVMSTALGRHYYYAREFERSRQEYQRALEMDSGYVNAHLGLGLAYVQLGEPRRAVAEYRAALRQLGGESPVVLALLAHAHARAGDASAARRILEPLRERAAREYVPPEYLALVYLGLDDRDRALDWLERALQNRATFLPFAGIEPLLDPLRGDPRFLALLHRAGVRPPAGTQAGRGSA